MGRKVGSFTNPETGQTNWVDLDNIQRLPIIPDQITRFKDVRETLVSYRLESNDREKMVQLFAEYEYQGERIVSSPISIPEETFARQLAEAVYGDNTIDSAPTIVEAKKMALQDIGESLLARGTLLGNAQLNGIGFVCSDGIRVISIEGMIVTAYQNGTADVKLVDCVGTASLKNVINPSIEFFTGNHKITVQNYTLKEDNNDLVRDYVVTIADVSIKPNEETIDYKAVKLNKEDEKSLEEFLAARKCLLDDGLSQESALDERFADMLD